MKVKDLIAKYGEYEVIEEKLEEILIKPKPKTIYELKNGEIYYTIRFNGSISKIVFRNNSTDNHLMMMENMFLTEEEALFEIERRYIEAEMIRLGGIRDMSFADYKEQYHGIAYNRMNNELYIYSILWVNYQGVIYFETKEKAKNAIDIIGEENIKKYIFNVKD